MVVLLERAESVRYKDNSLHGQWKCLCDCGNIKIVADKHLNRTTSCGCFRKTMNSKNIIHGMTRSPEYQAWIHMRSRCNGATKNVMEFAAYGGRGITVYEPWTRPDGFLDFLSHMGMRPSPDHSVDRIDVNGNYEPGNVQWANRIAQANNKRCNFKVEWHGEMKTLAEIGRETGVGYYSLYTAVRCRLESVYTAVPRFQAAQSQPDRASARQSSYELDSSPNPGA